MAMSEQAIGTIERDGAQEVERDPHKEAWIALVQAHAAVAGRVQEALAAADFPPLPWFEVLATLADAPQERMKMGDLAEALVITRGGLTKLVDRLIKAGLLERTFASAMRRCCRRAESCWRRCGQSPSPSCAPRSRPSSQSRKPRRCVRA
jgi:hypothetical protein